MASFKITELIWASWKFIDSLIVLLINLIKFIYEYIVKSISILINFICKSLRKIKKLFASIIQISCILLLLYNGYELTTDYLKFEYIYNLRSLENENFFKFPIVRICTDRGTLFDINKIKRYFDLSERQYSEYVSWANRTSGYIMDEDWMKSFRNILYFNFYRDYTSILFNELETFNLIYYTIHHDQFLNCSGKFHDNISMPMNYSCNVFMKTIIQDEKICYQLFDHNYSIMFDSNDFIRLIIDNFALDYFALNSVVVDNRGLEEKLKFTDPYLGTYFPFQIIAFNKYTNTSVRTDKLNFWYKNNFKMSIIDLPDLTRKSFSNNMVQDTTNDDHVTIMQFSLKKETDNEYYAERKVEFIQFMTDFGGLFGLYIGASLIDLSQYFDKLFRILIKIVNRISMLSLFAKIKQYLIKIRDFLRKLYKINWKLLLKYMSLLIISYQLFSLIKEYFQFETKLKFQFPEYETIDNMYSLNDFPIVSICFNQTTEYENILFERWMTIYRTYETFDEKFKLYTSDEIKLENIINKLKNIKKRTEEQDESLKWYEKKLRGLKFQLDLLRRIAKMSDKPILRDIIHGLIYKQFATRNIRSRKLKNFEIIFNYFSINKQDYYDKNGTQNLEIASRFFDLFIKIITDVYARNDIFDVEQLFTRSEIPLFYIKYKYLSPLGLCFSFSPWNETDIEKKFLTRGNILKLIQDNRPIKFVDTSQIIIHDEKTFPRLIKDRLNLMDQITGKYSIKIRKTVIEKLPSPYETQCTTQTDNAFQCFNKCFIRRFHTSFNCLPKVNKYHVTFLKNNNEIKFCKKLSEEDYHVQDEIRKICDNQCRIPCHETTYSTDIIYKQIYQEFPNIMQYNIQFSDNYYMIISYEARTTLKNLVINIVNTLSLWHGVSFYLIFTQLSTWKMILNIKIYLSHLITSLRILTSTSIIFQRLYLTSIFGKLKTAANKFIKIFVFILFAQQITSISYEYLSWNSNTLIEFGNNIDDNNYPIISIAFQHYHELRLQYCYRWVNNLPLYDEHGIRYSVEYREGYRELKSTQWIDEKLYPAYNLTAKLCLNRTIFYNQYWNKSDITLEEFYQDDKYWIGYRFSGPEYKTSLF